MSTVDPFTRATIIRCFRFMRLFDVVSFSILTASKGIVRALVAWPEDCKEGLPSLKTVQEIEWRSAHSEDVDDALTAAECAYDNGCIKSDIIRLDKAQLQSALSWDAQRLGRALDVLFMLRAEMIDNGTGGGDAFLLHTLPSQEASK